MKNRIEKQWKYQIILVLLCLLQIAIGCYLGSQKINFHVDEIATYGLANDGAGGWLTVPHAQTLSGSLFKEFVSASDHQFQYHDVWVNQAKDVHPPFYYAIIHTISSLVPGEFAVSAGIGLNIVLSVLLTIIMYAIGKCLFKKESSALLLAATWALSFGNINQVVFIRMYMLLALMITSLLLLHLYYYERKQNIIFYLVLIMLNVIGALTHYYYLVFLLFLALAFGINLLLKKEWKEAAQYIISLIISGVLSVLIFPDMLAHIFSGYRGVESFHNIFNLSDILGRLKWFFLTISRQLFAGTLPILLAALLILLILSCYQHHSGERVIRFVTVHKQITQIGMTLIACIGYYVIISKGAVMLFDRYIMPIYPVILVIIFAIIAYLPELFPRFKDYVGYVIILLLSIVGLATQTSDYLYRDSLPALEYAQSHAEEPVIVVCTMDSRLYTIYPELMSYKDVVVIKPNEVELLKQHGLDQYDHVLVYELVSAVDAANPINLDQIVQDNAGLSTAKEIYKKTNESTYITTTVYELK